MSKPSKEWSISYKQLGVIIAFFSLGLIVALLVSNSQETTQTNFTTTELIGFVLTVILSGASIVLAISAIALGKVSEQSVIERSDESIRLQNEVFVKTTEALQRIEASTGVTEKRIEDIISGRVGDISHQVAEIASRHSKQSPKATKELEEEIRQSLMQQVQNEGREERRVQREARKDMESKYQTSHDNILLGVGNLDGVKVEKLGHGTIGSEDGDVFDGLFEKHGEKFAVSTFRPDVSTSSLQAFMAALISESNRRGLSKVFLVVFKGEGTSNNNIEKLNKSKALLKNEFAEKIHFLACDFDSFNLAIETVANEL